MKWIFNSVLLVLVLLLVGCNTFNNPLTRMKPDYSAVPEEDLREAAMAIESAIQKGERELSLTSVGKIKLDTPEIQQSIRSRAARIELLTMIMDTGFAYEGPSSLVYILRNKEYKQATTSSKRDRDALLVTGENNDRWALYEGLIKHNNFPSKSRSAIQAVFYEARVALLKSGQKYKNASGDIVVK